MGRRPATPEEARALANPLRMRILRLCLDEALTNREIARRLDRDPGSTLHHVRMLVESGFLEPAGIRQGARGAFEKPYRATGKSWTLSVEEGEHSAAATSAMVEAFRDELAEAGPDSVVFLSRFASRLNEASLRELHERVTALVEEVARREDPDGERFGFLFGGHARDGARPGWASITETGG